MLECKPTVNNDIDCFMVEFPPVQGKRGRNYFKTKKEGEKAIADYEKAVKRAGEWWTRQPEDVRLSIQVTVNAIHNEGQTIAGVWKKFKEVKQVAALVKTPTAYEDCVAEWKRRQLGAGSDQKYVLHAGVDLMKFGVGQERRSIHEIEAIELDKWIAARKRSRNQGRILASRGDFPQSELG
jgi:hypothetical protein